MPARARSIRHSINMETLDLQAAATLDLNAIGVIEVETDRPILADLYSESRTTGSFILIDPASNATIGAGMIRYLLSGTVTNSEAQTPPPRIVLANAKRVAEIEQRLLDLGLPVVRTRVQDQAIWRALHEAGVIVLVDRDGDTVQILSKEFVPGTVTYDSAEALLAALDLNPAKERSA